MLILLEFRCNDLANVNITFAITTDNIIGLQNNLFANLSEIAKQRNADLYSDDKCVNDGISDCLPLLDSLL